MKYNLVDLKLRQVQQGKRNAGALFVQGTVVNPDDEYDEDFNMTTFNERLAKSLSQYLAISQPGPTDAFGQQTWLPSALRDASKPLPEKFTVFTHADIETFKFPGGPRVSLDDDGNPRTNDAGQYIIRDSVRVLTKKTVDNETGKERYATGWDPESQGLSLMNRLYGPLSLIQTNQSLGISLQPNNPPQLINSGTAAQPQQGTQPQQPVQQPVQQGTQQPPVTPQF